MTDSMYQETVQEEQKPVNQTYKGYVVDQAFESGSIYIDKQQTLLEYILHAGSKNRH